MTTDAQRKLIKKLIQLHTRRMTRNKAVAREGLIREGIYTEAGELAVEYGGKQPARRRKKA